MPWVRGAVRRSDRDSSGRASPTAADVGIVFVFHGVEPVEPADFRGARTEGELELNENDVQVMTSHLRAGLVAKLPDIVLEGEVEIDEAYVVAGHKGHPAAVQKKVRRAAATDSRALVAGARWRRKNRRSSV